MRVAIVGHGPEDFGDSHRAVKAVQEVIDQLRSEQGSDLFCLFNGEIGIGQWACDYAIKLNIPYGIYLIDSPEHMSEFWYPNQVKALHRQFELASAYYISKRGDYSSQRDNIYVIKKMIDDCSFLVTFWNGRKQGKTFEAIKHAFKNNKMVYNAYDVTKSRFNFNRADSLLKPVAKPLNY